MELNVNRLLNEIPKDIFNRFVPVAFKPGENIISFGFDVDYGYILVEGSIDTLHINFSEVIYIFNRDFNARFIGLMEIYSNNKTYCCTCRAKTLCKGYKISKSDLLLLLNNSDSFKKFLISYWASQFYNQAMNKVQYPNNSSEMKFINYLTNLITGINTGKGINIRLKREEIAEYIGCSKRTVYRILTKLESENFLNRSGHSIRITLNQQKRILEKNEINI